MALQFEIIPVTPFQQNCSLVWCDETMQAALVDPGGESSRLLERVSAHGVQLTQILLPTLTLIMQAQQANCLKIKACLLLVPMKVINFGLMV